MITELKLLGYIVGIYAVFIYWGYLQEKLTSTQYEVLNNETISLASWEYPPILNLLMSVSTFCTAWLVERCFHHNRVEAPFFAFWKSSLASALASPIGYESLKYISYPLLVLTKSSKPVPIMFVGVLFYNKKYYWWKYASVTLLCCGIAIFTSAKKKVVRTEGDETDMGFNLCYGLLLVLINLMLDGIRSNEQDKIFAQHQISSLQMMKHVNSWQTLYLCFYLVFDRLQAVITTGSGESSQWSRGSFMVWHCREVQWDLLLFCVCASVGQLLLFQVIKEFGSLVWITISVTRQLITVMASVIVFRHNVNLTQWVGVTSVFVGLGLDIAMNYMHPKSPRKANGKSKGSDKPKKGKNVPADRQALEVNPYLSDSVETDDERETWAEVVVKDRGVEKKKEQ